MAKFLSSSLFITFSVSIILVTSVNGNYTTGLIKYLKEKSGLHQVMFIIDDQILQNSSSSVNFLITDVSQNFPSFSIRLNETLRDPLRHFARSLQQPRRTTLFIIILNGNRKGNLSNVFGHLKKLSQGHSYPKYLMSIISQKKSHLIKEALEVFWSHDFLDVAVLEHLQENQKSLTKKTGRLPILHEINAFAKIYKSRKVTAQTKWFPDKLLNLYGHQIHFLMATANNNVKSLRRILNFGTLLASSMHASSKTTTVQFRDFNKLKNFLFKEKMEMLLNNVILRINDDQNNPKMRILGFSSVKAVIPNISSSSAVFVISQEFVHMIVATTVALCAIRLAALLMKFNQSTWQTFNISQMIMGLSIDREPKKLKERMVFGAVVLSCMVYSGYMYSVILDITLRTEPPISNLENSSLTPILDSVVNRTLLASSISYIRQLGMKSIEIPGGRIEQSCLAYLAKYQNVTCIIASAEEEIKKFTKVNPELNVIVLQQPLTYYIETWLTKNGSPFLYHFNKVILKASEAGLLPELEDSNPKIPSRPSPLELISKEKLLFILFYVLGIGLTLSIIVFIAEMVIAKIRSKLNYLRRQYLNC